MISFRVTFESPSLAALQRQVPRAIAASLNEGGDEVRTAVREALRTQTGVKAMASILTRTAASGVGANRAAPGRLIYTIVGTGKGMPITDFPVASTGRGIDAKSWGVDHLFKRSFEIKGRGPGGYRARLGRSRFPIRKLYGPAVPKELVKGESAATFYAAAARHVPPAVLKHLAGVIG